MQYKSLLNTIRISLLVLVYLIFHSQGNMNTWEKTPVRLGKKEEPIQKEKGWKLQPPKLTPELILIIVVISIIIILPIVLYTTGCMESTTYYNRGLI